jgi:hypothetical protein
MMYSQIDVEKVENGYVVEFWEWADEGGEEIKTRMVFEDMDDMGEDSGVECFARLLWYITEHFGMIGSKHDLKRIRISTENDDVSPQKL